MNRPDFGLPEEILREELALKLEKLRQIDAACRDLEFRMMGDRIDYLSSAFTSHLSPYFAHLDIEKALVCALDASPLYSELLERIDAIRFELKEKQMDLQDEVAA